ncbi:MAG: hypothetical protein HY727_08040 [Candidatus Rokubacteria bacterium]|nr:hypothetical protein [Candidatus Rokubacteria bacterium]
MTKAEYEALLVEIAGDPIGLLALRKREESERAITAATVDHYWGLVALGDAIHQFYSDTLLEVAPRLIDGTAATTEYISAQWHLVSFGRYAAAFDLFRRGYYFEAAALARGLWETALTLAALKRGVVNVDQLFGGPLGADGSSAKEMQVRMMRVDKQIQSALIWKNSQLSQSGRDAVETFLTLVNAATHKSKLHLALNLSRIRQGKAIALFPTFDAKYTEGSANILFLATWCLMATISYVEGLLPRAPGQWSERYRKVMLAFSEGISPAPSRVTQRFAEVVDRVFVNSS